MFGNGAFAESAFSTYGDPFVVLKGAAQISVDFNYRIYAATNELITAPDDTPASQPFNGTVGQPLQFQWTLLGTDSIGTFTTGQGTLTIDNTDAAYDQRTSGYAVDGREIVVRVGRTDDRGRMIDAYADSFLLARLTAASWQADENLLTVNLVDLSYKLDVPLQPNLYGGTGGADGGADLAGKRKPVALGQVFNVSPPNIVPVPDLQIYQVNDGQVAAIPAVYDRGSPLSIAADYPDFATLSAASIPAGSYATCLALGLFRLNSSPAGTVTADVQGDASLTGYVQTTPDLIQRVVTRATSLRYPDDFYLPAFTAVLRAQPAPVGYWAGEDDTSTVSDFAARLMAGIGGWAGFRRTGQFEIGIVRAPAGVPSARYGETDIIDKSIAPQPLPAAMNPPPWRVRIGYARNETVQTDLAGDVTADRKAFVAQQYRSAAAFSATIKVDHPLAQDPDVVEAYFTNQADAAAEAARRLAFTRASRSLYKMKVGPAAFDTLLGDTIFVTYPRWDLSVGRLMFVAQMAIDAGADTIEIVGYG